MAKKDKEPVNVDVDEDEYVVQKELETLMDNARYSDEYRELEDIARLKENNVDAVLIGETLMKSPDKKVMIRELKNG